MQKNISTLLTKNCVIVKFEDAKIFERSKNVEAILEIEADLKLHAEDLNCLITGDIFKDTVYIRYCYAPLIEDSELVKSYRLESNKMEIKLLTTWITNTVFDVK